MDLGQIQLTHAVTVKANILPAFAVPETVFQTFIKVLSPSPGRLEVHLLVPGLVTVGEQEHGHRHMGLWQSGTYSASTRLFRSLSFSSIS